MSQSYDVIVIGVGSMGAAACYELAARGVKVLGLEQFDIPNTRAAHHGYSRVFRTSYFEHPDYVALLQRSFDRFLEVEALSGQKLMHVTGGAYVGLPDGDLVKGSTGAAKKYSLPHESLTASELNERFPAFAAPDNFVAFFENNAGFLLPEAVVSTYAELALREGADIRAHQRVVRWQSHAEAGGDVSVAAGTPSEGVTVETEHDTFHAQRLLITAGAWSDRLLHDLNVKLTVTRQVMGWVWPRKPELFELGRFPVFAIDPAEPGDFVGVYYGFPMLPSGAGNPGFKIAMHYPAEVVDPDRVRQEPDDRDERSFRDGIERYFPQADGPTLAVRTCRYTNSADGHFVIDTHPHHANVTLACGFSGHGFKFVSVMGEALADMAQHGKTDWPIGFLGLSRFGQ